MHDNLKTTAQYLEDFETARAEEFECLRALDMSDNFVIRWHLKSKYSLLTKATLAAQHAYLWACKYIGEEHEPT